MASCHHTSRSAFQSTSWPVRRTTSTLRTDGASATASSTAGLSAIWEPRRFWPSVVITTLLWADLENRFVWVVLAVTIGFGVIGWVDDYRKVVNRDPKGLSAKTKFFYQSLIGVVAAYVIAFSTNLPAQTEFLERIEIRYGSFQHEVRIIPARTQMQQQPGTDGVVVAQPYCGARGFRGGRGRDQIRERVGSRVGAWRARECFARVERHAAL